jgi:hypothetical protein
MGQQKWVIRPKDLARAESALASGRELQAALRRGISDIKPTLDALASAIAAYKQAELPLAEPVRAKRKAPAR